MQLSNDQTGQQSKTCVSTHTVVGVINSKKFTKETRFLYWRKFLANTWQLTEL